MLTKSPSADKLKLKWRLHLRVKQYSLSVTFKSNYHCYLTTTAD